MPLAHDQFDNADRLQRFGVGDWVKASKFTPQLVAPKLRNLLESDSEGTKCREMSDKLSKKDGLSSAASMIEAIGVKNLS